MNIDNKIINWEVSIIELYEIDERLYKVTRRIPDAGVSETIIFRDKSEAVKQFEQWLV